MEIRINSVSFTADQKLSDQITAKCEKLEKYHNQLIKVNVQLKLENAGQIKDKIVEIDAYVPGKTIISKEVSKTFESAFDDALKSTIRQLKKHKEKLQAKPR